jgi:hypothetical protein
MPFNAVGGFVETKTFRLHTGIAGIFHRLGVNDDQRCPVRFFFTEKLGLKPRPSRTAFSLNTVA